MVRKGSKRGLKFVDVLLNQHHSGAQRLPDDLVVFEIIKRLPVKDVIQCKCVSKSWCSIIRQPEFAQAYRDFNPCCLIVSLPHFKRKYFQRLYYSPLQASEQETKFFPLYKDEKLCRLHEARETRVVNGLFCHCSDRYVFVCNVFTGEMMRLPDPPQYPPTSFCRSLQYYLGYDPVGRVYKLLLKRYFTNYGHRPMSNYQQSHILALGNNSSWKELVPDGAKRLYSLKSLSICINGVLYWIECVPKDDMFPTGYCLHFLNLSDGEEKIGYCPIPTYIRSNVRGLHYDLVQFRGRLCLLSCWGKQATFHTLEDCVGNQGNWTRFELFLPIQLHEDGNVVWMDSLPTGEVLFGTKRCVIYSYHYEDWRALRRHFFRGIGEKVDHIVFCGEPNIATLDTLINSNHI